MGNSPQPEAQGQFSTRVIECNRFGWTFSYDETFWKRLTFYHNQYSNEKYSSGIDSDVEEWEQLQFLIRQIQEGDPGKLIRCVSSAGVLKPYFVREVGPWRAYFYEVNHSKKSARGTVVFHKDDDMERLLDEDLNRKI